MVEPRDCDTKWSQKDKNKYHILTHIYAFYFLTIVINTCMRWYLIIVCFSLTWSLVTFRNFSCIYFNLYILYGETLEKVMAPHSSTLAWKIPWTEEPGGLQSMGSLTVRHDWATSLSLLCIGEENGNPLQCSCLENPKDRGAWWAAVSGVTQSWTRLKWLSSSMEKHLFKLLAYFFTFIEIQLTYNMYKIKQHSVMIWFMYMLGNYYCNNIS